MNQKEYYMISLKIESYPWCTRGCFAEPLHIISKDDNREFKNVHCDEKTVQALIDIIKDKLPEMDWLVATIKKEGL